MTSPATILRTAHDLEQQYTGHETAYLDFPETDHLDRLLACERAALCAGSLYLLLESGFWNSLASLWQQRSFKERNEVDRLLAASTSQVANR